MSLLLDALKKTGIARRGGNGHFTADHKIRLSLKEHDTEPSAHLPSSNSVLPARAAGNHLFAAKKASVRERFYDLGLVPAALIIGSVLAAAGSAYVWYELQPPPRAATRPAPPVPPLASAPAPKPLGQPAVAPPMAEEVPHVAARVTQSRTKEKPRTEQNPMAQRRAASSISIEHQPEADAVDATLAAAYEAYRQGDLGTAWQLYREVLQKDSRNPDALLGMAAIAQQQGQDDVAAQFYGQVLAQDPRDPVANAGMAAFATGDAASKESRLKQVLAQNPRSAAVHFALGNLYSEQSRWGEAQQAYFNAFRLDPVNAQFAFNLATSLDHLGRSKLAAQYYRQALKLDTSGNSGFDRVVTQQRAIKLSAP